MLTALTPDEHFAILKPLVTSVLKHANTEDLDLFLPLVWKRTAVACVPFVTRAVFDAMRVASGSNEAPPLVLTVSTPYSPEQPADWVRWNDFDVIPSVNHGGYWDICATMALIDLRGRWALQRHWEGFAILGGAPSWFARFLEAVGGRQVLIDELRADVDGYNIGNLRDPVWRRFQQELEALE
jgi:hypothetical protein